MLPPQETRRQTPCLNTSPGPPPCSSSPQNGARPPLLPHGARPPLLLPRWEAAGGVSADIPAPGVPRRERARGQERSAGRLGSGNAAGGVPGKRGRPRGAGGRGGPGCPGGRGAGRVPAHSGQAHWAARGGGTARTEPMEPMEAAGPQPGPGPAEGPQAGAEEIDMSLDDIIKRHRKEQTDASAAGDTRRQQVKNRNSAYGYGRPRFRAWMQRNLQGPNRFRRGFGQQQYNRRQFRNTVPGPRRRAAAALNGVSPLNRQALAQEGSKNSEAFTKSNSSGQPDGRRRPPPGPKRFRAAPSSNNAPGRRPFRLNRGPAFQQKRMQQRFSKANFQRGMDANGEGKPRRMRRWQVKPSPGAVLTVSVANPQAGQTGVPGSKRPFLRSQRPPPRAAKPQPKGVLLRFNFRAMANQVEDCRRDRRHLAPCSGPATKLLTSRSGFWGCQLGLSSITWEESPLAVLARVLAKLKAPEKTVQQLQTQPDFPHSFGPSWPVHVLAWSWEMLPVGSPGWGGSFHCQCSPLLRDTQHFWALLSLCFGDLLGAAFYAEVWSESPGTGQKSCSTFFIAGVSCLDSLVLLDALCSDAICLLLFLPRTPSVLGLGAAWRFSSRTQSVELLVSMC
ncbi:collagen alpha-1(I) chain-like isoform X4 [Falco peregrinus]|uniref:collagen alpha-1(I) chain-like isoform X4 n=1 Tax=Falco peregrinus TaxID=8954 RepID=UPI0024799A3B|nr:collagen alpha-1(I) chain-like isoform X4 [Falco peregrinus]